MEIFDLSLEQHLISGVLRYPNVFPDVDGYISDADFKNKLHKVIWSVIKQSLLNNEPIDRVLIAERINRLSLSFEDRISSVADYLEELSLNHIKEESVKLAAEQLKTVSIRRNIAQTGLEISTTMQKSTDLSAEEVVALSNSIYTKVVNNFKSKNDPIDLFRGAEDYIASLDNDAPSEEIECPYPLYQKFFGGFFPGDLVLFASAPKSGKALEENTPIPTPNGFKNIKDLKIGDEIFAYDGTITTVMAVKKWKNRELFKVTTNDGQKIVADAEHDWSVMPCRRNKKWKVLSTQQIFDANFSRPIKLPDSGPLVLPLKKLPIDPYVLGVWLGDGHSASARISQSESDGDFMISEFKKRGYLMKKSKSGKFLYHVSDLQSKLRANNLLNNKHIPSPYLRASQEQRTDLLKGLIDTDGHISKKKYGQIEFCTTSQKIAEGFIELIHSLAIKGQIKVSDAKLYGKICSKRFRITFHTKDVCRLPRKLASVNQNIRKKSRFISNIERHGKGNTVCIQIEHPSHLFLCGKAMIPTHNSTLLSDLLKRSCFSDSRVKGLIIDTELETYRVQRRNISAMSGVNEYLIKSKKWRQYPEYVAKIKQALTEIKAYFDKIDHVYVGNVSTEEMASIVRRWHWKKIKKGDKPLVAIDYFKLTGADKIDDAFSASMNLGYRVDTFKKLASELQCPILGACQTNKAGEVGLSHEVNKFVSSLFKFERKTDEEMERDNFNPTDPKNPSHKLVPLYTRDLGSYTEGINNLVPVTTGGKRQYIQNYLNFKLDNFTVTEAGDLREVIQKRDFKLNISKIRHDGELTPQFND